MFCREMHNLVDVPASAFFRHRTVSKMSGVTAKYHCMVAVRSVERHSEAFLDRDRRAASAAVCGTRWAPLTRRRTGLGECCFGDAQVKVTVETNDDTKFRSVVGVTWTLTTSLCRAGLLPRRTAPAVVPGRHSAVFALKRAQHLRIARVACGSVALVAFAAHAGGLIGVAVWPAVRARFEYHCAQPSACVGRFRRVDAVRRKIKRGERVRCRPELGTSVLKVKLIRSRPIDPARADGTGESAVAIVTHRDACRGIEAQ